MKKYFIKFNKNYSAKLFEDGFTIVETLIAISIFSVSIVALMFVLSTGISNANYAKRKIIATYLAQEGIEYVRNIRDNDILYTSINGNNWVTFIGAIARIVDPSPNPDFSRTIQIFTVPSDPNEVKVFSIVSWSENGGNYSVTLSEYLFNWVE